MSMEVFLGPWKIVEVVNISNSRNIVPALICGAVFVLQENGELKWELDKEIDKGFPLFSCDCYEVVHTFVGVCIQMGAVSGHMFEFWVDYGPRDMMLLTFEGWCMLQCQQIGGKHVPLDFPFSLLPALTEGYFADIKLPLEEKDGKANLKEFKVHSIVMELSGCDLKVVSKLSPEVLEITLHYIYSQSLPTSLTLGLAQRCIDEAPKEMHDFVGLCKDFIHRSNVKNKIVKLVNEVHGCAEAMKEAFHDHSVINSSRFCPVIKSAVRDAAVAFMKLVELCELYGHEAPTLQRNERLEILRYAKTRLPIFLVQFVALLRNVKNDFATVRPSERNDIAAQIASEIETFLDALSTLMKEARDACTEIWSRWSSSQHSSGSSKSQSDSEEVECSSNGSPLPEIDSLTESLMGIFKKREVVKLHQVQAQITAVYLYLAQKKENFEEMSTAVKIRCVSRNLEQLLEELPVFLLRLEEIMMAFDDRFQWKDFKFCLQLAISQVCQTVHHLRTERSRLQKFFMRLIELVQRDDLNQSIQALGLLEMPGDLVGSHIAAPKQKHLNNDTPENYDFDFNPEIGSKSSDRLNLFGNVCTPRRSSNSILAKNAMALFKSKKNSDMVFEICIQDAESVEILAHRVIVAARCDWFRRALLSGMKESIERRIVIHDFSALVFELFLQFVYTGNITGETTLETLSELVALSDRYELDSLKFYCEQELSFKHLDEASVIFLLNMADQYNARNLRGATMEFIAANPGVMAKEMFEELSPELQMEVYDITMWSKPKKVYSIPEELFSCPRYMLVPDSPSDDEP